LLRLPNPILDPFLREIDEKIALLRGARLLTLLTATKNHSSADGAFPRWV